MSLQSIVEEALHTGVLTVDQEHYITNLIWHCDWSQSETAALEVLTTALAADTVHLQS